jgi:hypothetical protein
MLRLETFYFNQLGFDSCSSLESSLWLFRYYSIYLAFIHAIGFTPQ